jgi:hypothetical protein
MLGPIEKKSFYWLFFRVSDEEDVDWYAGRVMLINGEFWLTLRVQDLALLPAVRPQTLLDETLLLERFDDELGGTYFVHRGPLRAKR